jgi:hypothetical protein
MLRQDLATESLLSISCADTQYARVQLQCSPSESSARPAPARQPRMRIAIDPQTVMHLKPSRSRIRKAQYSKSPRVHSFGRRMTTLSCRNRFISSAFL